MANRCYSLTVRGLLQDQFRENVLHFQSTGTADNDTVAAGESLIAGWIASVKTAFLATLPAAYCLTRLSARRVDLKPSATTHTYFPYFTAPGTRATDGTAQQTCPTIFLIPTMGTFSGGKIFWPTVPQGDLVNNVLASAWQTVVNTCISAMTSGFTNAGITWTLAIFSRKHGTISNVVGHTYSPLVGFQVGRRSYGEVRSRR